MHQGLNDEIKRIIIITLLGVLIGLLTGHVGESLLLAGFLYSCWLLFQTRRFYLWLESNMNETPPDSGGIWGDIFDGMYRMHQANHKNREEMQQQLDRVQNFTRALQTGIVLLTPQGNINWWNPAAGEMLGLKDETDQGKPLINLMRDPQFVNYFQKQELNETLVIAAPGDATRLLEIQVTRYNKDEKIVAIQDVTRLRRLESMRKDFVANVSHELRTPLTVINGYLESMVEHIDEFDKNWQQPISKINAQAQRMTEIVTDLSMLSKLDNSEMTDKKDRVSLESLVNRIIDDVQVMHADKKIQVSVEGSLFVVYGSETELQSCLSNLIHNAAKYSKPESAEIRIRSWVDTTGGHIAIEDNGIGIDPIHIPRLTERFYRVDSSHSRKTGGTGLGLAIVKHVLLRHQGSLEIRSTPGKGSAFTAHFSPAVLEKSSS